MRSGEVVPTSLWELDAALAHYLSNSTRPDGFVLNDLMPRSAAYGYRKYGYSYSYKYSAKRN